jgi:hypothetical protein
MKRTPIARKTPLKAKPPAVRQTFRDLTDADLPPGVTFRKGASVKRRSRPKKTPARSAARGQPCMVRLPGVCNGNPETTVLAHYRLAGYCGTGIKPDDKAFGAWACSSCHDECDHRTRQFADPLIVKLAHAEGVMRTIAARGAVA